MSVLENSSASGTPGATSLISVERNANTASPSQRSETAADARSTIAETEKASMGNTQKTPSASTQWHAPGSGIQFHNLIRFGIKFQYQYHVSPTFHPCDLR
jgi:hypothetical protein